MLLINLSFHVRSSVHALKVILLDLQKKQKIEPVLYMTEWFLCAFTRTLPWSTVLRVWDMFLCEGVKVLFRVALFLLKYTLGRAEVLKRCPTMYETLLMLKTLPNFVTHEQFLAYEILR